MARIKYFETGVFSYTESTGGFFGSPSEVKSFKGAVIAIPINVKWEFRIIDNLKYLLMCLTETGYGYIKEERENEASDATIPTDIKEVLDKLLGVYSKLTVVTVADLQEDIQEALNNNAMAKSDINLTSPIENAKLDIKDSEIFKAGSRNSKKDSELIQKIHDITLELGAMSPTGLTQKSETVDFHRCPLRRNLNESQSKQLPYIRLPQVFPLPQSHCHSFCF